MIRRAAVLALLAFILSGCAALIGHVPGDDAEAGGVAEPVMAPMAVMEPSVVVVNNDCQPDDDGIGGTGCPVK